MLGESMNESDMNPASDYCLLTVRTQVQPAELGNMLIGFLAESDEMSFCYLWTEPGWLFPLFPSLYDKLSGCWLSLHVCHKTSHPILDKKAKY